MFESFAREPWNQTFFFAFFSVPSEFRDRGASKQGPGTLERGEEFKGIKDYAPRSRFQAPGSPPPPPLAPARVPGHTLARARRGRALCLAVCVSLSIE